MTSTPKTIEELDKMRARAVCLDDDSSRCADICIPMREGLCLYLSNARAIREAEEAAGLVVVPVEATQKMVLAASRLHGRMPRIRQTEINAAIAAGAIQVKP